MRVGNKSNRVITLLTDFGDFYPGVMKGVMLSLTDATIVDISHSIEPQNVMQGAFLLYHSYRFFRNFGKAVHVAVVDPGVGTSRKALVIGAGEHVFVGPDNGILYPSASREGIESVWIIDESKTSAFTRELSSTFHGRDVFAPTAAFAVEERIEEVATPYNGEIQKIDLFKVNVADSDEIEAEVIFVDRFGNLITNIKREVVEELDAKAFYISGTEFPLVASYSDVELGHPLAIIGSFGTLELSVRNGSASQLFGVSSGKIKLGWR
jgi:hypothetical protein